MVAVVAADIRDFLAAPVWLALDVDDAGRVLAGCDAPGTIQLVELALDGTPTWLTDLPGGCSGRYLPGERRVVVEHDQDGDERQQLSLLSLEELPPAPVGLAGLEPLVRDPRFVHQLVGVRPGQVVYSTNRRNGVDFDVVIRDLGTGAEREVYAAGGLVEEVALPPSGEMAVLSLAARCPMSAQLLQVDPLGAPARELTGASLPAQHLLAGFAGPTRLIVTTDREREHTVIAELDLANRRWRELISRPGLDVSGYLAPGSSRLLLRVNRGGRAELELHDVDGDRAPLPVTMPGAGWLGEPRLPSPVWAPSGRWAAMSFSSPTVPGDALRLDGLTGAVTTVASSQGALSAQRLSEPTLHDVPSPAGRPIPCWVYAPTSPGSQVAGSAVVLLHGGPESQAVASFNPVVQGLAAAGHTVLVPNVRGSTGYGRSWYSADDGLRRLEAVADLEAIHAWLPQVGIDQSRAALWGGSYGGYMVLAGLAFQPQLWAAGVDIVGMSSLVTFLRNTSGYRRAAREREYGSLETDLEFLERASPLSRVDSIRAPLFLIHGANDPRVPLSEAEQLAERLAERQVECHLLVYQDEGHGLARRHNRLDAFPQALDFLARHLSG
jgi:dipeptidyl aminopeptidase/acylaminoacyl peptidase